MRTLIRQAFVCLLATVTASLLLAPPASATQSEPIQNRARDVFVTAMQGMEAVFAYVEAVDPSPACPVPSEFTDTWGAPRSGGRGHTGVDMLAPEGTPIVAPVAGHVEHRSVSLGGQSFYLADHDGREWFGTHLSAYGTAGEVQRGEVIGYVGDDGNAAGTFHLHLGLTVAGEAVNPFPLVEEACHGNPTPIPRVAVRQPTFPYGVMEIHRWANATFGRIDGFTARVLTRYLNTVVGNRLRAYLQAVEESSLVWHWQLVAECESGDDIYAVSSSGTYKGWLQFDQSSWTANGGSGSPYGQPRHVAARIAENYRLRSGTSPWPVCGVHYR